MMCDNNFQYFHAQESDKQENHHEYQHHSAEESDSNLHFDFLALISKPKDYYRILEVDYDASEEEIRSNFIKLALQKDQDDSTSRFQEINEAYQVLSDPDKRQEYDQKGMLYAYDYNTIEYLNRYKGLILTCNGLGMKCSLW
ncbi:hypothetical protein Leryth_017219 [Lithospermum erythrorhizon]|nr:hypothetical protein Leryth_017219 [Lithospermum erythrorhizon]